MTAAKPAADSWRKKLLGKVHIGKKALAWDDDTYRSVLIRLFNKSSAGDLSLTQLGTLLDHMKDQGFRGTYTARVGRQMAKNVSRETIKGPNAPVIAKLRAQWIALHHLGVVTDPKDSALLAFAARQTKNATLDGRGVQALAWLTPQDGYRVIEALKDWGSRAGIDWAASRSPRVCVLEAQARKCVELGLFQYVDQIDMRAFKLFGGSDWRKGDPKQLDALMQILGGEIRRATQGRSA